ncbi:PI-PLC X domain-containing protein 1 [Golovinomyces cichoracearum]|uniref:PI-PLC X domain-containing protein 1 n=1 Tax=Golovinomyces cichoracearum TaxID=62708 RepID=A0A420J7P6_9PEZI|nr:PI-PLC X domain-containing protein 1 [Golovinomyces cichoracearum]
MFFGLSIATICCFVGFVSSQGTCNGNAALCSRKYSNVTQVGTHDSAFVGEFVTQNQIMSVSEQLTAGVRFLQTQTHVKNGVLQMCHTSCDLEDAGTLVKYLSTIKDFIELNPNEVITILLTNGDRAPLPMFGAEMVNSGLAKYAFIPPKQLAIDEWPTLQELIKAGTPIVMFLDYGASSDQVPYILDEFKYFFETSFDVTDPNFSSCALDRPPASDGTNLMMVTEKSSLPFGYIVTNFINNKLINHFLDRSILGGILIPDRDASPRTNAATGAGSIGAHSDLCRQKWGRKPNMILIDYFGNGDALTAQNNINGLEAQPKGIL